MANEYELQRLIQQAKQDQAFAEAQAQREAEQAKITKKLTIESTFRQELERDLSVEVCRSLGIQYEWVPVDGAIFHTVQQDYGRLLDYWQETNTHRCYIATFMLRQQKMAIFRYIEFGYDYTRRWPQYFLYNFTYISQHNS